MGTAFACNCWLLKKECSTMRVIYPCFHPWKIFLYVCILSSSSLSGQANAFCTTWHFLSTNLQSQHQVDLQSNFLNPIPSRLQPEVISPSFGDSRHTLLLGSTLYVVAGVALEALMHQRSLISMGTTPSPLFVHTTIQSSI